MIEVKQLKSVSFIDVLDKLKSDSPQLPNLYDKLWTEISKSYYGNQQFHNDSFFRYWFELDERGYYKNITQSILVEYCYSINAVNIYPGIDGECGFILFDVCW